jgi:hypothetical protein
MHPDFITKTSEHTQRRASGSLEPLLQNSHDGGSLEA